MTDNNGGTAIDLIVVTVQNVNGLPTANAGLDQGVNENDPVTLSGSGSDSDGTITGYSWTQTAGTPTVTLTGASSATAGFTAPSVAANTDLTFQLTVTDNNGGTATDLIVVPVQKGHIDPTRRDSA